MVPRRLGVGGRAAAFALALAATGGATAIVAGSSPLIPASAPASRSHAAIAAPHVPPLMQACAPDGAARDGHAAWSGASAAAAGDDPASGAAVYNLRVVSDASPDLADLSGFIASTTSRWPSAREKVWALFYWTHILKRQTTPMVLHGFEVTDPIRNFNDYGYTMCSTISGINQALYEEAGLPHQYWDICNHTVSTVHYDGKFRMVDSSMSNLVTTDDGVSLASIEEAAADSARLVKERSLYATSPNGFLTGSDTMRHLPDGVNPSTGAAVSGFARNFCAGGLKHRDYYYNWDAGHRYVLNLRQNESYTRYYRRLGTTADYYVGSEKINSPNPATTIEIDSGNTFGLRGNGSWTFTPDLSAAAWTHAAYSSRHIVPASGGGLRPGLDGQAGEVVYKVQAANAIASQRIEARFARTDPAGTASLAISVNHGITWTPIGTLGPEVGSDVALILNLRNEVNGAYETLVRVQLAPPAGNPEGIAITALTIATITHLNAKALPRLNVGRNEIVVGAGDQLETMVLWPDLRGDLWKRDVFQAHNIGSQSVTVPRRYTAVVYPAVLTEDAHLVYRMEAPADIRRVTYGGRLHNYTSGSYIDFLHSFDEGATWTRSYRLSTTAKPYDVIHYETIPDVPAGVRTVLFKFLLHNTHDTATRAAGLYGVRMEVNHEPAAAAAKPVDVTFRWKEIQADRSQVERSHRQRAAEFPFKYVVNVGGNDHPVMESMKISLEDPADATPYGYGDGVDPGGARHLPARRSEGRHLSVNRPYTFSRAPSGFQSSAGAAQTTVLTDGVVGAPATGSFSYWWGQCWTSGGTVDLDVDLGSTQAVGAARAHLFGYPGWDALKGQVQDRVEVLTSVDGATFVSRGLIPTSLWRKDLPVNHMLQDDEKATGWNFELTLPEQVQARHVRYRITPKRNLCVSELQVFDRVDYEPFDLRIALPAAPGPPPVNQAPGVRLTSPAAGAAFAAPAAITIDAHAWDVDGSVVRVEFLVDGAAVDTDTAAPWTTTWSTGLAGTYSLAARVVDDAGDSVTSAAVAVTVTEPANRAPAAALTAPADGTRFDAPASIVLAADATDTDGAIERVDFFAGAALIGSSTTSPFSVSWDDVPAGAYTLTARAVDDDGAATTSPPIGVVVADPSNVDPVVTLTAPAEGLRFEAPAAIALAADANDTDGQVARVEFYADSALLGAATTLPFTFTWENVPAGTYALSARAIDDRGGSAASAAVTAVVEAAQTSSIDEVVMHAADAPVVAGAWKIVADITAAGGQRLQNPNAGAAKLSTPRASPVDYFEMTFHAEAGRPYRLWMRGRAEGNAYANDSVYAQFDGARDAGGQPVYRIGTTSATTLILEDCNACGLQGWGWQDNGYGQGALGPAIYFAATGPQRLRIQSREDGLGIDQIVLSAVRYLGEAPGAQKNDATILAATPQPGGGNAAPHVQLLTPAAGSSFTAPSAITVSADATDTDGTIARVEFYAGGTLLGTSTASPYAISWDDPAAGNYTLTARAVDDEGASSTSAPVGIVVRAAGGGSTDEIVLYASGAPVAAGAWLPVDDATAAGGRRLQNPNAGAAKVATPAAAPADYFELTFDAEAGKPYRLWIRGRAEGNAYTNDSVYVQFDGSTNASGQPVYRIGTTSATSVVLEDCNGCGLQGWGWQDNGYGQGVLGPAIYFAASGPQRVRIQAREDGLGIDQVVLSAVRYLSAAPGAVKNDTTILAGQ